MVKAHWSRAEPASGWSAKTWPSSCVHDHPHGCGLASGEVACICVHARCMCSVLCILASLLLSMPALARMSVLAWRAWPQGAWAASEGPACPQSLTICALLVVIKVSNLEVSWGLAKRGQKMSLRCSSWWAAATVFTYLYTLIVFALLPWHWGNCGLVVEKERKCRETHKHSHRKFGCSVDLNE